MGPARFRCATLLEILLCCYLMVKIRAEFEVVPKFHEHYRNLSSVVKWSVSLPVTQETGIQIPAGEKTFRLQVYCSLLLVLETKNICNFGPRTEIEFLNHEFDFSVNFTYLQSSWFYDILVPLIERLLRDCQQLR